MQKPLDGTNLLPYVTHTRSNRHNTDMKPLQIKQALEQKEVRQIDVVVSLGMSKTSRPIVSAVINGTSRSRRIEKAISKITGIPLQQLWPDWYSPDGKPVKRSKAA